MSVSKLEEKLNEQIIENNKLKAVRIPFDSSKIKDFVASLPFQLTNAQRRAVWDISSWHQSSGAV